MKKLLLYASLLWLTPRVYAQQATAGTAKVQYQYMHISYNAGEIVFLPAYNGKESIKVSEVREAGTDRRRAALEAMSKVLNELAADGWEVVSAVPVTTMINGSGGFAGIIYVMRKPK